ncbi:sigma-70 family RNA polymerase sigma factor [Methylophaga sp.]|jgi:RNA polymerase sigma-70 factor (ECF subfamily)|uniref:RNA polymerase sigma factor n=1 Tax=Methylophaga sp. TaxID=2024840 RepID=UPI0013FEB071|nr:sigma-70 family RNA polymerase sigma factor [Methylophaga sp.]MTI63498.1 sigma-70 family RNA polymerase sigma factor [Methylophaga sp.]
MNDDIAILHQIAAGSQQALAEFYRRYESRLYRFICSKMPDQFEAADLVNEVFLEVWQKAAEFQQRSKVSTWLFSIAYFKTVDRLRKTRPEALSEEALDNLEDDSPASLTCLIQAEQADQVRHCVSTLKPDHRAVMELTFFEEMSYRDIATVVNCPENTVKTRMFHAKQAMKKCLQRLAGGGLSHE